uniref:ARAD1A09064p n=1 Tax=Blastobotrys adeninivorans TaxID=409370 RepID=A0A060SXF6_BLAAD
MIQLNVTILTYFTIHCTNGANTPIVAMGQWYLCCNAANAYVPMCLHPCTITPMHMVFKVPMEQLQIYLLVCTSTTTCNRLDQCHCYIHLKTSLDEVKSQRG